MKKLFSFMILISSLIGALGQVSYQENDFASVGESFIVSTAPITPGGPDFAQTGTSFSWDYSTLIPNTQETRAYIDPDNGGYQASWITNCILTTGGVFTCPGKWNDLTNLALENEDNTSFLNLLPVGVSNVVTHFDNDNGLLQEAMLGISVGAGGVNLPLTIDYDIPDTIYRFPIDYQDVDSSEKEYAIDLTNFGADFIYRLKQKRVNTVEGWGQLITPFATFSSTLKMRTVIYHQDSTTIGGNTIPANVSTEVQYSWFDKGTGIPVLVASGLIVAGTEIITSVDFVDSVRCFAPTANFLTNPLLVIVDPISLDADVNFANLSQNADTYKWYFGDGDSSTQVNPSHTYDGGLYTVSLIACNSICDPLECDTSNFPLLVIDSSAVVANWTAAPNIPCEGEAINFNNFSFNGDTYLWDFGDGNTSTVSAPQHTYQSSGDYTVTLIAYSGTKTDTSERIVSVNSEPEAFAGNDTTIGLGQSLNLQAIGGGAGGDYVWNFNTSLSCIFCDNPVASPNQTTDYIVRVSNSCGVDRDTITVRVDSTASGIKNQLDLQSWKIYPNPFSDKITLEYAGQTEPFQISVINLTGQEVKTWRFQTGKKEVNLSDLAPGLYMLKISNQSGLTAFTKLVRNE